MDRIYQLRTYFADSNPEVENKINMFVENQPKDIITSVISVSRTGNAFTVCYSKEKKNEKNQA